MKRKVDYDTLRREYITGQLSIRQLADKHDVAWSSVAQQARTPNADGKKWTDLRAEFRAQATAKTMERDSSRYALQAEDLQFEMIQAARAVIFKVLEGMREGTVVPQPRDMLLAIDKLQLLTGRPTERTEETIIGSSTAIIGQLQDPEFLRRLEELTRGVSDVSSGVARLRIEGSKPN